MGGLNECAVGCWLRWVAGGDECARGVNNVGGWGRTTPVELVVVGVAAEVERV